MALLGSFVPFLPVLLQLLGWGLKIYGASDETLKQYNALVQQSAKDNLISVNLRDRLLSQREKIQERIKQKEQENEQGSKQPPAT